MLPAMARLPQVVSLIGKKQCFVGRAHRDARHPRLQGEDPSRFRDDGFGEPVQRDYEGDDVNALARWCVEEIHGERYGETITAEDMCEAKENIIRERGTHLDSLMERLLLLTGPMLQPFSGSHNRTRRGQK